MQSHNVETDGPPQAHFCPIPFHSWQSIWVPAFENPFMGGSMTFRRCGALAGVLGSSVPGWFGGESSGQKCNDRICPCGWWVCPVDQEVPMPSPNGDLVPELTKPVCARWETHQDAARHTTTHLAPGTAPTFMFGSGLEMCVSSHGVLKRPTKLGYEMEVTPFRPAPGFLQVSWRRSFSFLVFADQMMFIFPNWVKLPWHGEEGYSMFFFHRLSGPHIQAFWGPFLNEGIECFRG